MTDHIAKCPNGHTPVVREVYPDGFFVVCEFESLICWSGPIRKTRAGAIAAWNERMEAKR